MKKIDTSKLVAHLDGTWKNKECMICGSSQWTVSDKIHQLREYEDGGIITGSNIFPVVPIVCRNCGLTIFINPVVAKVLKEEEE